MKNPDRFYLATLISTLMVRIAVWVNPVASPTINGFRLHHWMYGAAGVLLLFVIRRFYKNIMLLGTALGVFLDEFGYILINGKTHEDNYSPMSFMLIMILEVVLFILRKPISDFYMKESE